MCIAACVLSILLYGKLSSNVGLPSVSELLEHSGQVSQELWIPPLSYPTSFRINRSSLAVYERVDPSIHQNSPARREPDTTAIVLNWSRFPNVLRIVSLLCSSHLEDTIAEAHLEDTIAEVVVWNNNLIQLSHKDFEGTRCPQRRLRIVNSPTNIYFQARFLACAEATTEICFVQDDDYLVVPEIIRAIHTRFSELEPGRTLHLLPPHEHLTSALRTVYDPARTIHTSFAWLGHGALLRRSHAAEFLALLGRLGAGDDEVKMADNYFTVLRNVVPELYFDQGIELAGGQPFTIGQTGHERNMRHIRQAWRYLVREVEQLESSGPQPPYLASTDKDSSRYPHQARTVCIGSSCVLETNIRLLPLLHDAEAAEDVLQIEKRRLELLGQKWKGNYLHHPPSFAVDGQADTAFYSPSNAAAGDTISLDMLDSAEGWDILEIVWLVDLHTERILQRCSFETSSDGQKWRVLRLANVLSCDDTPVEGEHPDVRGGLRECAASVSPASSMTSEERRPPRLHRVRLLEDSKERWRVYEVWMRGVRRT